MPLKQYSKKTLNALSKSITKWRKNDKAKTTEDMNVTTTGCPLCELYHEQFTGKRVSCIGCPIADDSGSYCEGTPYDKIFAMFLKGKKTISTKRMLDYLIELQKRIRANQK